MTKITQKNHRFESKVPALKEIFDKITSYALSESPILIQGEQGTGKKTIAKLYHDLSARNQFSFVHIDCSALAQEENFERQLFGDAANGSDGLIDQANHGTLFLEDVSKLSSSLQSKLLRVIQDKKTTRVGAEGTPTPLDLRIITSTPVDLDQLCKQKKFRDDLFYSLSVIHVKIPSLHNRIADLPDLCNAIRNELVSTHPEWAEKTFSSAAHAFMRRYEWPGNLRQLEIKIEDALISSGNRDQVEPKDFHLGSVGVAPQPISETNDGNVLEFPYNAPGAMNLREARDQFEQKFIAMALEQAKGNKTQAAKLLGLSREGLRKAMGKKAA